MKPRKRKKEKKEMKQMTMKNGDSYEKVTAMQESVIF